MPKPDLIRDDDFEESIASLYTFETPTDRARAKECIGIARHRIIRARTDIPDTLDQAIDEIIRQYDLNDLEERSDDDALEISLRDLRELKRARDDAATHVTGDITYHLEWIGAPRPPTHPSDMVGRQRFANFEGAIQFMDSQPDDSRFVSLEQVEKRNVDISEAARQAIETLKTKRKKT